MNILLAMDCDDVEDLKKQKHLQFPYLSKWMSKIIAKSKKTKPQVTTKLKNTYPKIGSRGSSSHRYAA